MHSIKSIDREREHRKKITSTTTTTTTIEKKDQNYKKLEKDRATVQFMFDISVLISYFDSLLMRREIELPAKLYLPSPTNLIRWQ